MNVLSTLISNSTKVKEILKEQSIELGVIENKCLGKITTAKQKSKAIFTGLQKVQH